MLQVEFPEDLLFLVNEPARYKVLFGGRGGMKTETVALALIILATQKKLRIACFREIQKSIDESVYQTIKNRVIDMGLEDEFDIQAKTIISKRTGAEFIFFGLRYNINSIKSLARIDIAWVEEASVTSKTSWDKLIPTIRGRGKNVILPNIDENKGGPFGQGTEIWITFNPELDTDETYKRFVLKRDQFAPDFITKGDEKIRYAFVRMLSYKDNPWLPDDLKLECELLKAADEDEWMHVWGGQTRQTLTGAIYAKEIKKVLLDGRRGKVPYDPSRPVHTFWDLGHDDFTSIWFVQQVGVEYNLINYFQDRLQKIPYYLEHLQNLHYTYGFHYLPHDAVNETLASRSVAKFVRAAYPDKVKIVPRVSKKIVGIRAARTIFDLCNFDEENTADGWQCLCRYQFKVNEDTGQFSNEPLHNEYSHGCFTAETLILTREGPKAISTLPVNGEVLTLWGWMPYNNPRLTQKNAQLVEVRFNNEYTVKCTPDHLFLTEKGWISAQFLKPGLLIQSGLVLQNNFSTIEYIEYTNLTNISQALKHCIETFGNLHLVQFLKAVIFIIKTKIKQTTNCGIWNVCLGGNIYSLPGNYLQIRERNLSLIMKQEKRQQNGIAQTMGENGTLNTQLMFGKGKSKFVSIVKKNLTPFHNKNIALMNALKYLMNKKELLDRNKLGFQIEYVKNAIKNLTLKENKADQIKNTVLLNAGKPLIKSVILLDETRDVYCLTVPNCGHFALANGAIVKNCDAFQEFALSLKPEQVVKIRTVASGKRTFIAPRSNGWMA